MTNSPFIFWVGVIPDIDECSSGTHDCRQNQICQNRPGGFTCLCPQGYTVGADRQCQDIDECTRFAGQICSSSATCVNTPGSYRCQCKDGFRSGTDSRSCVGKLSLLFHLFSSTENLILLASAIKIPPTATKRSLLIVELLGSIRYRRMFRDSETVSAHMCQHVGFVRV